MIVAFNSMEREGKESAVNMIAAALAMTTEKKERVILLESGFGQHMVQDAVDTDTGMLVREPFAYMGGEGMDYLMKTSRYDMLSERNAAGGIVYVNDNLGYVPSAIRSNRMLYEAEFSRECQNILHQLDPLTDYVFVDCSYASEEIKRKIQAKAQLIVTNVSQSEKVLDEFFSCLPEVRHKAVYCIGNYMREEPCNLKNIQRLYRIDSAQIGVVPYNVEFLSSLQRGKAAAFFQNHMLRVQRERNRKFFREIHHLTKIIEEWEVEKERES